MRRPLFVFLLCLSAGVGFAGTNLVRNPGLDVDANRDGVPDAWRAAGDQKLVTQSLTLDAGRSGRCGKLACTAFAPGNPAAHAMVCQMDVPVRRGANYRVSFWAKGSGIRDEVVSVALSDTRSWQNCGLNDAFTPAPDWERHEFLFAATRDCPTGSRFQLWFKSTGTLWLDDVVFEEAEGELRRPGHLIPSKGRKNLIPNASFEAGETGWGSECLDAAASWRTPMNRLFGRRDTHQASHGYASLRIDLPSAEQPVAYFDYFDLTHMPVWAPLAANIGYLEVEPGKAHTFSAYMRAEQTGVPARLMVQEFEGGRQQKLVRLTTDWGRYALTFTPRKSACYVLAGPDLRKTDDSPTPPEKAIVWLDALQLERGTKPTVFTPRADSEFSLSISVEMPPDHPAAPLGGVGLEGNVYPWGSQMCVSHLFTKYAPEPRLELSLTDFLDRKVWSKTYDREIPTESRLPLGLCGAYTLHAAVTVNGKTDVYTLRFALVPELTGKDSRFGMNHAYPWPDLLRLNRLAGLTWVRDWSLKWHQVEPTKGAFDFSATDLQIDRVLERGLNVLALAPFPSSVWASTATPEPKAKAKSYPERRAIIAMAPQKMADFENYARRTVAHYKGRITWWQVFNEPLYTHYSLPRRHGYTGADLATYTIAFARAARAANPDCKILGGIGAISEGQIMEDFRQFFAAGGLAAIDAVDIHHYPRTRPPEFIEPLLEKMNALMDQHGGCKPMWLTEYGYYADDAPWAVPMPHQGFNRPLRSEALQCAYIVRWTALCVANGVEKIFYHAGTCDAVNRDSLQGIFYEFGPAPHKVYAAQAVLAHLFPPTSRFVHKLDRGDGTRAYLFQDGKRLVCVVWSHGGARRPLRLADDGLVLWDIMGKPLEARTFTPSEMPVYVIGNGVSVERFVAGLR
jgi:hypothetical protein